MYNTETYNVFSIRKGYRGIASRIDPKLENLDVSVSADEILEYIVRFNFWIDSRESSDDKAIKGAFLTAVGNIYLTGNVGLP